MKLKVYSNDDISVVTDNTAESSILFEPEELRTPHRKRKIMPRFAMSKYKILQTDRKDLNPIIRKLSQSDVIHASEIYDMTNIFTVELDPRVEDNTEDLPFDERRYHDLQSQIGTFGSTDGSVNENYKLREKTAKYDTFFIGTIEIRDPNKSARRKIEKTVATSGNFLIDIAFDSQDEGIRHDLFPEQMFTDIIPGNFDDFIFNNEFNESPFKLLPDEDFQELSYTEEQPSDNNSQANDDNFDEQFSTSDDQGDKTEVIENAKLTFNFSNEDGMYTGDAIITPKGPIAHGRGKIFFSNGDIYEGPLKLGVIHGKQATFVSKSDGTRYSGSYKLNKKHGIGKQSYPDGKLYTGNFKNDLPHGYGVEVDVNGKNIHFGQWKEGQPLL